jgi:redox-sensitive bicupin YhaK (pirin superfamily)
MLKEILAINNYSTTKVGPFNIKQPLPHGNIEYFDPFVLLHHGGPDAYGPGQASARLMPHPHRGFEPVTFLFDGEIYHKDSTGAEGFLKKGDVQWTTSGSGILHSEGPTENFSKNGGTMEIIQLWVNLPKKDKMTEPHYQQVNKNDMPHFYSKNKYIEVQLVSGSYNGLQGVIKTFSPVISMMGVFDGEDEITFTFDEAYNSMLYLLNGNMVVNDTEVKGNQCVFFKHVGQDIKINTVSKGKFLLLSGQRLNEPMLSYGPFVMNTEAELIQAVKDYNAGKMGRLES